MHHYINKTAGSKRENEGWAYNGQKNMGNIGDEQWNRGYPIFRQSLLKLARLPDSEWQAVLELLSLMYKMKVNLGFANYLCQIRETVDVTFLAASPWAA